MIPNLIGNIGDEAERETNLFGATNSTDSMEIIGFIVRECHLYDVRNAGNVDATSCYISTE